MPSRKTFFLTDRTQPERPSALCVLVYCFGHTAEVGRVFLIKIQKNPIHDKEKFQAEKIAASPKNTESLVDQGLRVVERAIDGALSLG